MAAHAFVSFQQTKTGPDFKGTTEIARAWEHELIQRGYKSGNLIQKEPISQADAAPRPRLRYFSCVLWHSTRVPLPSEPNPYQTQTTRPRSAPPLALSGVRSAEDMLQKAVRATRH